jgi:RND family efflux transporter MFP subunit
MIRILTDWRGFLLLAAVPMTWLGGCEPQNEFKPPPPPTVTVARPVTRPVAETIQFTGTTRATATVDLRARVGGYLDRIEFKDGAEVEQGDLLFVIDQTLFEVQLAAAEAELQKAKANLTLAEDDLSRIRRLHQRGSATDSELTAQEAEQATAAASVAVANAAVRRARKQLDYTEIRAPISGRIGRHLVDVGNLIQEGTTPLATIESIDPLHAYFSISESDLQKLRHLDPQPWDATADSDVTAVSASPGSSPESPVLHLGLAERAQETSADSGDDAAKFPYRGHFDFRELGVDPKTGTILGRGVFPNQNGELLPGLFVRIRVSLGKPEPRLLIDGRAVGMDQRGEYVLVVNDTNTVERRPVVLGRQVEGLRVVESGIEPGDRIVVNGLQRARPGSEVTPMESEAAEDTRMTKAE